jgi:hypothetical protein
MTLELKGEQPSLIEEARRNRFASYAASENMRGSENAVRIRTKTALAVGTLLGVAALIRFFTGSESLPPLPSPQAAPSGELQRLAAGARKSQPGVADSALSKLRRERLPIPNRLFSSTRIAVSGERVIRVTSEGVVVNDVHSTWEKEVNLKGAFLVSRLPLLGLLAVGSDKMLVFDKGSVEPRTFPRVTVFPGSRLLPDLGSVDKIWVWHRGAETLYGYELANVVGAQLLAPERTTALPGFDGRLLTGLRDGSFLYTEGAVLLRWFVGGQPRPLSPIYEQAPLLRALLARRVDEFMLLYDDGTLELLHLQDRLKRRALYRFSQLPFDLVSTEHGAFALLASAREGGPRRWSLRFLSQKLEAIAEVELAPGPEAPGADWLEKETQDRQLAADGPWVVLGGADRLMVWDVRAVKRKAPR